MKIITTLLVLCISFSGFAQENALYDRLPIGPYSVGFRILTITDSTRVIKPRYNYFGEKETGDRFRNITIHIWYPCRPNSGKGKLKYADYCFNNTLKSTNESISVGDRDRMVENAKQGQRRFFGEIDSVEWQRVVRMEMLSLKDAVPLQDEFPLLIGLLRPLSTTVTNELLASNGYVVAMIVGLDGRWPAGFINDISDMQKVIAYLGSFMNIEKDNVGSYGFSGSGFAQLLLAMNDPRISAYADIESALYGQGVAQILSSSNYYDISKMRVPFLHIYGKELAKSDVNFQDFLSTKYSNRYHLLLNYSYLHHWDVATEGRLSTTVLHTRGDREAAIKASYELANIYLLNFFNAILKKTESSKKMIEGQSRPGNYADSLWSITLYPALQPPPDRKQFAEYINRNGIQKGLHFARDFYKQDSTTDFVHENALNATAQDFMADNKVMEAIELMKLSVEFHPREAWLWNNLGSMQEDTGKKDDAIRSSQTAVDLLKDYKGEASSYENRIKKSAEDRIKRLKTNS